MSQIVVKRPPRALPPDVPTDEVQLTAPPELSRPEQGGLLTQFLPLLGMGGSMVCFFNSGAGPFMRVMGWMMLVSALATIAAQVVRFRRGTEGRTAGARRDYLRYLAHIRRGVRRTARSQLEVLLYLHPAPDQLWAMVAEGSRVWERRLGDEDFGQVRVGVGPQQLSTPLVAPTTAPVDELEPLAAGAMQKFLMLHGAVDGLPVAVSLRRFYHLTVAGDADTARGTARAVVGQLVTFHSPEDLAVAVLAGGPDAVARWDWTKWLPHTQVPGALDGAGTRRLFCQDADQLEALLAGGGPDGSGGPLAGRPRFNPDGPPVLDARHVVVILDGGTVSSDALLAHADGIQGVTVIEVVPGELDEPRGSLSVDVRPGRLVLRSAAGLVYEGEPDTLPLEAAEALARQLAPLRVGVGDQGEPLLAELDFTDLLDLGDAASVDATRTWRPRTTAERLRVPIGAGEDGEPVMLDLKEAAQGGMGPHGLCVGATGSGKSELLRTLVLALAVTHSSEHLNLVLADFKGGATFTGMAELPHVSAVITNLADDLTLVDRMEDSIRGELQRRQEMLRGAGNYANVHDYERARAAGAPLEPLPTLLLIIDEFSELLSAKPDFIEMFIQIGRIGRSLGVHLLLSSQRLEEGRLRGLDTYLSYRIGLRTFSATESRAAIGVADAYHLPTLPGSGYLKFGTDEMVRFKAAYVSGAYRTHDPAVDGGDGASPLDRRPALFTAEPVPASYASPAPARGAAPPDDAPSDDTLSDTVLDVIVRRLEGQGPAAHEVWQPPLDASPALDELLPPLATSPARGLHAPDYARPGDLVVPVGLVDKPFEQRREVLYRDFSDAAGNLLVVGGPQSGKSTLLRTLIASFALTHTPREAQFYGLDFGGGGLSAIAGLPHVGTVASRLDPERVRRTVAEVIGVLTDHEELFRARGIDSIATYRKRRAVGELPDESWGDVFLVIDGWGAFKQEHEALEGPVMDLATRGLGYGVHLVLTATRSMEVRAALKDQFMNRLELRLGDPLDSDFNRRTAANVPVGVPGRGQTAEGLHFLAAQPRLGATAADTDSTSDAGPTAPTDPTDPAVGTHPVVGTDAPAGTDPTAGTDATAGANVTTAAEPTTGTGPAASLGPTASTNLTSAAGPAFTTEPAAATSALVRAVSAHWPGPGAPEVRVLPRELPADQLPKPLDHPHLGLPIGIDEDSLAPVFIDFDAAPFFLIFGESESGKTSLLRLLARQISERYTPDEARIVVGDYRRTLLEAVPESHLLEYAPAAPALEMHMDALSALMRHRAPGPDVTPRQLRARDWWSGPRFFVIVDDYELVATSAGNPLDHLLSALPFARDVGVHLIIARSTAGASRTSYEPFLQRVKELGAQGVILSGDPGEGDLLGGTRPRRLPPGRATLITRKSGTPLIQLGWLPDQLGSE
ncbi:type VII secretion protein EccCa [Streptomyces sp. NPDC019937]|uniref:type VII secretion protein EccCa n=1 Tax=Streptomyces sp. NPDC019937 TaxID=3154787 RepID=UPI0033E6B798